MDRLSRPVVARLAEPLFWLLAAPAWTGEAALERLGALFLAARLFAVTAPNLRAAVLLERLPFDQRAIRRSLSRVQLTLATLCVVPLAALSLGAPESPPRLPSSAGGVLLSWLVLASYALATPELRDHRGVPVARPNLGPAAGAALFLVWSLFGPGGRPERVAATAGAFILAGNLGVGLAQRYLAALRRLSRPMPLAAADGRLGETVRPRIEGDLVRSALAATPLLWFVARPLFAAAWNGGVASLAAAAALSLPALPPLLFDATRPRPRFVAASWLSAGAAAVLSQHLQSPFLVAAALTCACEPLLGRMLDRGHHARALLAVTAPLVLPFVTSRPSALLELLVCLPLALAWATPSPRNPADAPPRPPPW